MDRKIGVIASDAGLKNSIIELFPDEVKNGEIIIDILDSARIEEQGKMLESMGAKAIIGRSGGYRHTVGRVNVPVIHLKVSTLDILQAIRAASKYNKDIILVISDLEYFDYEQWNNIVSQNIIVERFHSMDEIEDKVTKYIDKKDEIVIVGGGIPCSYAKKFEMDNISIGASKESIYEGINYARELIDNLQEQKYKNQVLKSILDGVHDAVVAINTEGKIILHNERAEAILKKQTRDVMDKQLLNVYPELSFMLDILKNKTNEYNEIKSLKKIVIASNTTLLEVDGQVRGVICSFQDITKLQNLEKKIRFELNKKGLVTKYSFKDIIAYDPSMKNTLSKAMKIAQTDNTVMIYGESGTGKEMIAQSIHNLSGRSEEAFVAVNCAAISETLLESELFGYEEGAFTGARKGGKAGLFELAHKGTIFLDEINSISLSLQAKLLRVLEEKEIMRIGSDYVIPLDVRIIAAANENLIDKVKEGSFRSDLFYRLNILELHIPSLRERKMDIIPLFKYYINKFSKEALELNISEELKEKLIRYEWPGNVRELRNMAQRYIIFGEIDLDEGELIKVSNESCSDDSDISKKPIDLKEINKYVEEKVIEMLLKQGMSKTEIARQLGISRTSLWKKTKS
ncbi:sigma 54-interacting transcriptional regulator [Clostridium sp. SYSU_GA19001]|uniref:sigma 54-interacting transcriptional regulator n=1 Tax=Clostridium caldaquaticum TaxID=2940653 RepID=UPI002077505F|nr:sigma 54-interacting transcriptional regulator [Clostridium caldaquaticum]MCM8711913.1 sigma 54-interacting transcriptional regulator [Clostridium caldaquaticum]